MRQRKTKSDSASAGASAKKSAAEVITVAEAASIIKTSDNDHRTNNSHIVKDDQQTIALLIQQLEDERSKTAALTRELEEERSARSAMEQDRKDAMFEFRAILNTSPSLFWLKDAHNNIIYANIAAAASMGKTVEELEGRSTYDLYPDEAAAYYADDCLVLQSGQPRLGIVEQMVTSSGEKRWVRTDKYPYRNTAGEVVGVLVIANDITELVRQKDERESLMMQVARALEESQERYYLAIRGSNDGLWDWNVKTGEVFYSPRYKELLGYRDDEFPNKFETWHSHLHPEDLARTMAAVENHLKRRIPYECEFRLRNKNGVYTWFSARGQALWDDAGDAVRMSGSQRDITDRKQAEQNVNEFFSTVSHELRTPLAAIKGSLRLIEGGLAGHISKESRELLEIALSSSERLIRLVNDILDLRKIEAGKMELRPAPTTSEVIVNQLVRSLRPLAQERDIKLTAKKHQTVILNVDQDRVLQVLTNLVINAIKFSPSKTSVTVAVKRAGKSRVRFLVIDEGPGIPLESRGDLFKKFKQLDQSDTRSQEGSGLGLAICKAIILQHKGEIGVDSDGKSGSTFWIELDCES